MKSAHKHPRIDAIDGTQQAPHQPGANYNLRAFVGAHATLMHLRSAVPEAGVFLLAHDAPACVTPLTDTLHDAMHSAFGTGDWLKGGVQITTRDAALAARISLAGPLAYIEMTGAGAAPGQNAMVWISGAQAGKPMSLSAHQAPARPRTLWPVNLALKQLSVPTPAGMDEAGVIGLFGFADAHDIEARAARLA